MRRYPQVRLRGRGSCSTTRLSSQGVRPSSVIYSGLRDPDGTKKPGRYANRNAPVREALLLEKGDALVFEIDAAGLATVRKAVPLDDGFNRALGAALSEWESAEDDEAYSGL